MDDPRKTIVIAGGVVVLVALSVSRHKPFAGPYPVAFTALVACLVMGELRPLKWLRRREGGEVTVSWTFAFATLLIASPTRDAAIARLRRALSDLDDPDHDFSAHIDADLGFHLLLCQLTGNSVLVDAWQHLEGRVRITIFSDNERHLNILSGSHHAPIVDAIEEGDADQAVKILQAHMMLAVDRLAG